MIYLNVRFRAQAEGHLSSIPVGRLLDSHRIVELFEASWKRTSFRNAFT